MVQDRGEPSLSDGVAAPPALAIADSRSALRVLGAALVSAAILALLLLLMPWREVVRLWQHVSPAALVAAAAALGATYVVAGIRLATMLPHGAGGLRGYVAASLWHGLGMIVLPVRLGELALVDGLKRYAGVGAGGGLAVLLVQRIYDLLVVVLAFAVGVVALLAGHPPTLLALAAALVVLLLLARFLDRLLGIGAAWLAGGGGRVRTQLHAVLVEAQDAAASLATERVPVVIAGTVAFWVADFFALWLIFRAFDVAPGALTVLFLGAGLALVHAVPLPTIGGLGLAESGLAGLLTLTGMPAATALGVGVSVRLTLLGLHGVVIALGLPPLARTRPRVEHAR